MLVIPPDMTPFPIFFFINLTGSIFTNILHLCRIILVLVHLSYIFFRPILVYCKKNKSLYFPPLFLVKHLIHLGTLI